MRIIKTLQFVVGMAATMATTVAAQSPQNGKLDGETVRTALARHDLYGASNAFNALVENRLPSKQTNRPDPLLDGLLVEQMVALGAQPAPAILQRLAADAGAPDRIHNLLLLATAKEAGGEDEQASEQYDIVARSAAATADQRFSGQLGLARLKMSTDAAASLTMLRAIDRSSLPRERLWELDLFMARAMTIALPADVEAQQTQLAKAWVGAPDANITDHAIARVASDTSIAAARAGNRAKLVSLLAVDRANRSANAGQNSLAAGLPICGENGVTRDDVVIIEAQRVPPPERPGIGLVWANRPGIGKAFVDAARRSGQLVVNDGAVAQFSLRCRTAPSPEYATAIKLDDVMAAWMTSKGAYPIISSDGETQSSTQLATLLASRTTRYGVNSIMRLPVLVQLMATVFPQVGADEQARTRINDLVSQISAILDANDAPEDMRLAWRIGSLGMSLATQAKTPAEVQTGVQATLVAAAGNPAVSRDLLYSVATGLSNQPASPSEFKEAVLSAVLRLVDTGPRDDPRARATAIRLYTLRAGNGDMVGADTALNGRKVAADLCALANPQTHYVSSNIRTEDYPSDMVYTAIMGVTPAEFDLDLSGQAINGRLLVSDPPYVFDEITLSGISTVRYDPPRRQGKVQACRGQTQSVRWQLPY